MWNIFFSGFLVYLFALLESLLRFYHHQRCDYYYYYAIEWSISFRAGSNWIYIINRFEKVHTKRIHRRTKLNGDRIVLYMEFDGEKKKNVWQNRFSITRYTRLDWRSLIVVGDVDRAGISVNVCVRLVRSRRAFFSQVGIYSVVCTLEFGAWMHSRSWQTIVLCATQRSKVQCWFCLHNDFYSKNETKKATFCM